MECKTWKVLPPVGFGVSGQVDLVSRLIAGMIGAVMRLIGDNFLISMTTEHDPSSPGNRKLQFSKRPYPIP